ncbi:MAG: hypothetical protein IJX74_03005 [Clostridia bacterium]|nr:hypothetical protein [Clostridia bacterium]
MTQAEMFGGARWIGADAESYGGVIVRKSFEYTGGNATLRLIGLGTFEAFINGKVSKIISDGSERWANSFVKESELHHGETHD